MPDLSPALARRLAAYSATAGVALAVAPEADAQVVYYDFEPDIVTCAAYGLDFDDDGAVDLRVSPEAYPAYGCYYNRTYTYVMALRRPDGADPRNGVLGYDLFGGFPEGYGAATRLSGGELVGPLSPREGFYTYALLASSQAQPRNWPFSGEEGYAGFRFVAGDGQIHYGWLRLFVEESATYVTLYEYAYESAPGAPIIAGAVSSAVVLTGTVESLHFPAEGGRLRGTVTLTNTTSVALPLDLWIEAVLDGAIVYNRRLGSGTLTGGATVTRPLDVVVPANAEGGTYFVQLKVGDFETGQHLTLRGFEVEKEPPAVGVRSGGASFISQPFEGDLFAAPAVSSPATHTLGVPAPNPSDGRTALTLQVAEAQAARVEVLDALGRRVALLHDGTMAAGAEHRLVFDGANLPSGVYVVRATGETFSDARVLTLTR